MNPQYMQYGCGWCAPESWLNFDASPTLRVEHLPLLGRWCNRNSRRFPPNVKYGDITKGLPVSHNSCTSVYCSHVLEHLAMDDFQLALKNTYKYLKPGGLFRFVLPDLEQLAKNYLSDGSAQAAIKFMEASYLGTKARRRGASGLFVSWLGNSAHLWMWDEKSMREQLQRHGFREIRRASFGDAEDRHFEEVEDRERFQGALAIQCKK